MAATKWELFFIFVLAMKTRSVSTTAIDVEGGPASVVWVVQLSDLHFSVFHPERALDFKRVVGPSLAMIKPSLVLITGDLTDGKSKDLLTMKQEEAEWMEYEEATEDVITRSGLDRRFFYDIRGNHDSFGVPEIGGAYDFYNKYSINTRLGRNGSIQSIILQNAGWKHLFVGFDSAMKIGLRGPTNLFGHPTDRLLEDIDMRLSQCDNQLTMSPVTKISFGHFPLSFSASTETGKTLKDLFLKHSVSAYLCGHLHTRFGKNLKRHHIPLSSEYYQFNIHQGSEIDPTRKNCSETSESTKEFWEWEMGDWRKSRSMRIIAIDSGHVSFVDINLTSGSKDTIILPTFPLDSQFMGRISSSRDYKCMTMRTSLSYETIRALIFSRKIIVSVQVKIYDSQPGNLNLVLDSAMKKLVGNESRGEMYVAPWNWRAFVDLSPDRYWMQIEAVDISGRVTSSQLRPFSINGLVAKFGWTWKEFFVMGCQWAAMYRSILWFITLFLFSLLLIPRIFLICSKNIYIYKKFGPSFRGMVGGAFWVLIEFSRMTILWSGMVLYVVYLTFFPWFFGHVFTKSGNKGYMTSKGWSVRISETGNRVIIGSPDIMVIVLPHLCFVVLPAILVLAAMSAERVAYRTHYLSLSGKKKDDHCIGSEKQAKPSNLRWMRKLLLLASLLILWKHWKQCRAIVKAYEMNPFLHSPLYCFLIPALLTYAIFSTSSA